MTSESLYYLIRHVFLPPVLPQSDDYTPKRSKELIRACLDGLKDLLNHIPEDKGSPWRVLLTMLYSMKNMRHSNGTLDGDKFISSVRSMRAGDVLGLHIVAQNAGLIIRRLDDVYLFELFELSPRSKDVMKTKGRLIRCFPGPSIAVRVDRIKEQSFLNELGDCISELDQHTPADAIPRTWKAGSRHAEVRDTIDPRFATEFLVSILRAVGTPYKARRVYKRTRDDVLWNNVLVPWRRSPMWLLLRVVFQTTLVNADPESGNGQYKCFILFLLKRILGHATEATTSSDLLYPMIAKVARRMIKLDGKHGCISLGSVKAQLEKSNQALTERWKALTVSPNQPSAWVKWISSASSPFPDTELKLANLGPYLHHIQARASQKANRDIKLHYLPRLSFNQNGLPQIRQLGDRDGRTYIAELEHWVETDLFAWVESNIEQTNSCESVSSFLGGYLSLAEQLYERKTEDTSRMLLIAMSIWMALDECACHHCPLLEDYRVPLPSNLFEPLLLCKRDQLEQLDRLEQYLNTRRRRAKVDYPCIFSAIRDPNCFTARYVDNSPSHEQLRCKIVDSATQERSARLKEYRRKKELYQFLVDNWSKKQCDMVESWFGGTRYLIHSEICQKCAKLAEANNFNIDVHEWPLPEDPLVLKTVLFYLDPPSSVLAWLNTTFHLIVDVLSSAQATKGDRNNLFTLDVYPELEPFCKDPHSRLQPASFVMPVKVTHYRYKDISTARVDDVTVQNGLWLDMCDTADVLKASSRMGLCDIRDQCIERFGEGQYKRLEYTKDSTAHTSNDLIATQTYCPASLSLHEHYAFGSLRAGHRLQWFNLERELIAQVINFNHRETQILIAHAIHQAGPRGDGGIHRETHLPLEDETFISRLIPSLANAVSAVEQNWQGVVGMQTFTMVVRRVLSVTASVANQGQCFKLLRNVRSITQQWTRQLNAQVQEAGEEDIPQLSSLTLEAALTCYETFNVDQHLLPNLLSTDEDLADILECSVIIHDRSAPIVANAPTQTKTLFYRYQRISRDVTSFLLGRDIQNGLHCAVGRVWAGYARSAPWTLVKSNEPWFVTAISGDHDCRVKSVHCNIQTGQLLVEGFPLTRLPKEYEFHPTYARLFGKRILEVVPSSMEGMQFETRSEVFGHRVHFAMDGGNLVIRAVKATQIYEIIPSTKIIGDFPQAMIKDYVPWLDINTHIIGWRPFDDFWTGESCRWYLRFGSSGKGYLDCGSFVRLVDKRSPTATAVEALLEPLEFAAYIHVFWDSHLNTLNVHLPRLKLDFFLGPGDTALKSKQYRGMVVDKNQEFGTLTGLQNKLVLKHPGNGSRNVIIPAGKITPCRTGDCDHVRVTIHTGTHSHVPYHCYRIDQYLGRLVDNGTLSAKLFRCYLHALTAYCLPDELTGLTGTEQALEILSDASTLSQLTSTEDDLLLLTNIASLTPSRTFYPTRLQVMQRVKWSDLPPLSQHVSFRPFVERFCKLVRRQSSLNAHQGGSVPEFEFNGREQHLLDRAAVRNSYCYIDGFGGESHTLSMDDTYGARDAPSYSAREMHVLRTAKLVDQWSEKLCISRNLWQDINEWATTVQGSSTSSNQLLNLGYRTKWLERPELIFPDKFLSICAALSGSTREKDKYMVMFFLSTLSYSGQIDQRFVETLLAFATSTRLRDLQLPSYQRFPLRDGSLPDRAPLAAIAKSAIKRQDQWPEIRLLQLPRETDADFEKRQLDQQKANSNRAIEHFLDLLFAQWPVFKAQDPHRDDLTAYISVPAAMESVNVKFASWYVNFRLQKFIECAQNILDSLVPDSFRTENYAIDYPMDLYSAKKACVCFSDLLRNPAPFLSLTNVEPFVLSLKSNVENPQTADKLDALLAKLSGEATKHYEVVYASDIESSLSAFRGSDRTQQPMIELSVGERQRRVEMYLLQSQRQVHTYYTAIVEAFFSKAHAVRVAGTARLSPRLSPMYLLRKLRKNEAEKLPMKWRTVLLDYALAIAQLQRAQRMLNCLDSDLDLAREIENKGHEGWDPQDYPEWALFEIENNLLIRKPQASIALQMISPPSGENTVMQLNMGEGKSSVIVPIVAASLADGMKLARVVVLKPLMKQMFCMLANKLGGLLGHPVYQVPISRDLCLNHQVFDAITELYHECLNNRGILLVQPEHILSFELMGLDQLLSWSSLWDGPYRRQQWLNHFSRDILDESDEILGVKLELIYTMGKQKDLEFSPHRWKIIQHVLGLANKCAKVVAKRSGRDIEVRPICPGSKLNRIRLLEDRAGQKLVELIAHAICDSGVPGLPVWNLSMDERRQLLSFLTNINIGKEDVPLVHNLILHDGISANFLLLMRGLLAGGILTFVLGHKRWRVNYGLDLCRSMLAVPYRAKDTPATRAEFSHPDVTMTLTCLTYYYQGLSDDQISKAFERLETADNADEEYASWVADSISMPTACRQLKGVNLKNGKQCREELFPALRFSKSVVDFYLAQVVFPAEMKEFPQKLSSSGWNIARAKAHPTTGFSGTKDSKYLLPLSISQAELDDQLHTNAMQLDCLLQEENTVHPLMSRFKNLDAKTLLKLVASCEPPVRVILDAGAQVLELQNEEVARHWLALAPSAQAAVYFDEQNELTVLSRDGFKEALIMSPFAHQTDQCLVYLDEAHTRGTDLALPATYRAAVTLGPGLTKDRLVQACMRMRKLGQGQSVLFCASADIHRRILQCNGKRSGTIVEVADVLKWSINETHTSTRKACPLWATQGFRYQRQESVHLSSKHMATTLSQAAQSMLEKEAKTITERYGWDDADKTLFYDVEDESTSHQTEKIRERCRQFEVISADGAALHEEQERELCPENERERQVQRPPAADPIPHGLHPDVESFVVSGDLMRSSNAFQPAFDSLRSTSAAIHFEKCAWPKDILVTTDWAATVTRPKHGVNDFFLRPVHWVASSVANRKIILVILSPYEANLAIPLMRQSGRVSLHIYNPRTSGNMQSTDDLSFYATPTSKRPTTHSSEIMQLNLFAGQVYLKTYEEYVALCRFLGLGFKQTQENIRIFGDGFVDPADREQYDVGMARECPFSKSPVPFIRDLLGFRRKGVSYEKSHLGAILNGELLTRDKFGG